jgi:hypothetical protein
VFQGHNLWPTQHEVRNPELRAFIGAVRIV